MIDAGTRRMAVLVGSGVAGVAIGGVIGDRTRGATPVVAGIGTMFAGPLVGRFHPMGGAAVGLAGLGMVVGGQLGRTDAERAGTPFDRSFRTSDPLVTKTAVLAAGGGAALAGVIVGMASHSLARGVLAAVAGGVAAGATAQGITVPTSPQDFRLQVVTPDDFATRYLAAYADGQRGLRIGAPVDGVSTSTVDYRDITPQARAAGPDLYVARTADGHGNQDGVATWAEIASAARELDGSITEAGESRDGRLQRHELELALRGTTQY